MNAFTDNIEKIRSYINNLKIKTECYLELSQSTRIRLRGQKIEDISKSCVLGGRISVFLDGHRLIRTMNDVSEREIHNTFKEILEEQKYVGQYDKKNKTKNYTYREAVSNVDENDDEIIHILMNINNNILAIPKVDTTIISFGKVRKYTCFISSDGRMICQNKFDSISNFAAVVQEGRRVTTYPISVGSGRDCSYLLDYEQDIIKPLYRMSTTEKTIALKDKKYTILLDQTTSGALIHEVLGHLLEADNFSEFGESLRYLKMDKSIAPKSLNVFDCPRIEGIRGSYYFDDEGNPAQKTILVSSGKLVGLMHSNETAAAFNVSSTANSRALNYRFEPLVRMSNICVSKGKNSFDEMMKSIEEGLLIIGLKGASTNIENFTLIPNEGYLIKNGHIVGRCNDFALLGNLNILMNITMIGNNIKVVQGYSCNKYAQRGLPVAYVAPCFLIKEGEVMTLK